MNLSPLIIIAIIKYYSNISPLMHC